MKRFDEIKDALDYTVNTLIAQKHGFIINVLGFGEASSGNAATLQVVAQHMIAGDGEPGLTVHLPFDPQSGQSKVLLRFLETDLATPISEYKYDGIPCFYATFGTDADRAFRVILHLLVQLYGYSPSADFACEVHDEGELSRAARWRAPPGGWDAPNNDG